MHTRLRRPRPGASSPTTRSDFDLAEAYKYAVVPRQDEPTGPVTFDVVALDQQGSVAQRASRKLISQGNLAIQFPPVMLRLKLDNELSSRWEDGHVAASQLWEDFAKYLYLPTATRPRGTARHDRSRPVIHRVAVGGLRSLGGTRRRNGPVPRVGRRLAPRPDHSHCRAGEARVCDRSDRGRGRQCSGRLPFNGRFGWVS